MRCATFVSVAAAAVCASAATQGLSQGFNYGSSHPDGTPMLQQDFENAFKGAQSLTGAPGFTSARLYTMADASNPSNVISAIQAAINTKTTLLLGLWASGSGFAAEFQLLKTALDTYKTDLTNIIVGISVGSEDLYRNSPIDKAVEVGAQPDGIAMNITSVKDELKSRGLNNIPVGHVDTWTAWVNGSNAAVVTASDFIGLDAYPYFQSDNSIGQGKGLFQTAYNNVVGVVNGKPIWVTETGWPTTGPTVDKAVPSTANAQTYWDSVGCDLLFGKSNVWWYTYQDKPTQAGGVSFGVVDTIGGSPLFDLSCSATAFSSASSSSAPASSSSSTVSKATASSAQSSASSSASASNSNSAATSAQSASAGTTSASGAATTTPSTVALSGGPTTLATYGGVAPAASSAVSVETLGSSTVVSGGNTLTVYQTTLVTITSCSSECTTGTLAGAASASASVSAQPVSATSASASGTAAAAASSCPADLNGDYQYPHLIIPVSSNTPNIAAGTQYNATIDSTMCSIFNFDIPASYAGKTCSLVFLFPEQSQLQTSAYTFNNQGGLEFSVLSQPATQSTTYANKPSTLDTAGSIPALTPGNSYALKSVSCPAGQTFAFDVTSSGGAALNFFEDYNPSPLGLYVRAC